MKKYLILTIIIVSIIIVSCSAKVPVPIAPANGLIAIPIQATNNTGTQYSYSYELISSFDSEISFTVSPGLNLEFGFSKELPPQKYYYDKVRLIHHNPSSYDLETSEPRSLQNTIVVKVQSGTVTISDQKLVIEKVLSKTEQKTYSSYWNFYNINDSEMQTYIEKFRSLENSNKWQVIGSN